MATPEPLMQSEAGEAAPAPAAQDERLKPAIAVAFGLPGFAGAAMAIPIAVHLSIFYSDTILLPLGFIAVVKAVARAFDAITDPIMGWASDRTQSRWGRRRPWMFVGAPLAAVCFVVMFAPPESLSIGAAAAWFCASYVMYYLFHTVYSITHYGLGPEITLNYRDRITLFGYERAFMVAGTLVAAILPGVLQTWMGVRESMVTFASIFAVILTVSYWWLCYRIKERPDFLSRKPNPLVPGLRRVLRNRVFRILLAKYASGSLTGAIPGTMMPFFTTYVLQPENPGAWISFYLAIYFGLGFVCLPGWIWAARRFGKKQAWLASMIPGGTGSFMLFFMGPGDFLLTGWILGWAGTAFAAGMTISPAMQADVIDYDELYSGKRREAQFGSLWSVMTKFIVIPSMSIPLAILAVYGYQPNVEQSDTVKFVISAIFGLAPASTAVIGFLIALLYPISERVHQQIWDGIQAHRRGEPATDPLTGRVVLPPNDRGVDEDTGWFLDHFSPRELERSNARGPSVLMARAVLWTSLSLALFVGAGWVALVESVDLADKPGLLAVLCIVASGVGLTSFCFHAVRIRAARRMIGQPISPEIVRAHLEVTESLRHGPPSAPA
ncbi:MAG: MFS transporter [Deltaproteobacteria bacterium]|nr:MFS transporter [Deltaproteobacteria bacterium]MBW2413292.1 MFS transporter [Deltaproteobacteria bacterium]